jgi:hypothetical protein
MSDHDIAAWQAAYTEAARIGSIRRAKLRIGVARPHEEPAALLEHHAWCVLGYMDRLSADIIITHREGRQ